LLAIISLRSPRWPIGHYCWRQDRSRSRVRFLKQYRPICKRIPRQLATAAAEYVPGSHRRVHPILLRRDASGCQSAIGLLAGHQQY
jgi:hypothetical protein